MMTSKWEVWYWNFDLEVLGGDKPRAVFDTREEAAEYGERLWNKLDRNGLSDMVGVRLVEVEE